MALQQASLDFFNTPPEEKKPVAAPVQEKEQTPELNLVAEPALVDKEEIKETSQSPSGTPGVTPELIPGNTTNVSELHNVATVELEIDEAVRDLDFVVKEIRPVPLRTGKKSTRGRMKLSDMDILVDLVDVPADEVLFQKRYYNIGAVSDMFKVNISLIRFWENEFDILKPKKNGKGDRLFRPEDIKNLQLIYHLLREKKYTIDGAKDFLKKNKKAEDSFAVIGSLKKIKSFLLELKSNL